MNGTDVQKMILRAKGDRSLRAFAADWGIDHAYLYRMMTGEREPSDDVLNILGLYRTVSYVKRKSK